MPSLSASDVKLLTALQQDGRLTTAELAERAGLSSSACWRRIKALEEDGTITGYHARVAPQAFGYAVTAFVLITVASHQDEDAVAFETAIQLMPEITACHAVSGTPDFIVQVVAEGLDSYADGVLMKLRRLPGVREIKTSFILKELKGTPVISPPR